MPAPRVETHELADHRPPSHWRDRLYAALRCVCFTFTIVFGWTCQTPGTFGPTVILMSTFFGMYSVVCYGVWRYLVPTLPSSRFHIVVSLLDLIFVVVLLAITGGPDSPLSRGLYIWVSMAAIMFGYRGGWLVAPVAAIVFIALEAYEGWSLDGWERTFYLLGFLIHGPFIGAISSRERNRSEVLEVLNSRLELAHERLKAHQARAIQSEKSATVGLLGANLAH